MLLFALEEGFGSCRTQNALGKINISHKILFALYFLTFHLTSLFPIDPTVT